MLVIDSSIAIPAVASDRGFAFLGRDPLVAPPILWSEVRSALHEAVWRGELSAAGALVSLQELDGGAVTARTHRRLGITAWNLATEFGWAKTYDAEFVALATLLDCRMVTRDSRLIRGAARLGLVVAPEDL